MRLSHVGSLQTGDDRRAKVHFVDNIDQTLGDCIASDDTAENVDEDSGDLGVAGDKLESGSNSLWGSTATNIEEVGGAATVELDDVHGCHCKTSSVDLGSPLARIPRPGAKLGDLPKQPISPSNLMKFNPDLEPVPG